jgi:hypothetical protein
VLQHPAANFLGGPSRRSIYVCHRLKRVNVIIYFSFDPPGPDGQDGLFHRDTSMSLIVCL